MDRRVARFAAEMYRDVVDGSRRRPVSGGAAAPAPVAPMASTSSISKTRSRSGETKPNLARWAVLERCAEACPRIAEGHGERLMGACVFQMRPGLDADAVRGDALVRDLRSGLIGQRSQALFRMFETIERRVELHLAEGADIGEAHAVGRQNPGEGMQDHRRHAQRIGDEAGVLPARAPEARQARIS
jgi:hypothetical protein